MNIGIPNLVHTMQTERGIH